ncbi:MAG TPA: glycosyltransferase [Verrucomicrobiae bacterium]
MHRAQWPALQPVTCNFQPATPNLHPAPTPTPWLLLLDSSAPWVRSLFSVLPGVPERRRRVLAFRVHSLSYWLLSQPTDHRPPPTDHRPPSTVHCPRSPALTESTLLLPGWTLSEPLSTALTIRALQRAINRLGPPEAIIYTLPQYAAVARHFAARHTQIYYAYDPYRFYTGWDPHRIDTLERQILHAVSLAFAVARQLVDDLQARAPANLPVLYSPNAVSADFITQLRSHNLPVPADLADLDRPGAKNKIVGSIGHLHPLACDWPLIQHLAAASPDVTFVFIGDSPRATRHPNQPHRAALDRPNIRCLGPKPHHQLPAYLHRFDVCLNPLASTDHNHRRSPLRLYDYLATDNPILSTAIREAGEHNGNVQIGRNPDELTFLLRRMLDGSLSPDLDARRRYIAANTWEHRAAAFWDNITRAHNRTSDVGARSITPTPVR